MYLKPIAGCQISILIFEKKIVEEGGLYKYPIKNYQGRQRSSHFGLKLKVFPGSLTDLSFLVG